MLIEQETKDKYEGRVFETKNDGKLRVIEYRGHLDVIVKFEDTGYVTSVQAGALITGKIKDHFKPSVRGVGIVGKEQVKINGKHTKEYNLWRAMIDRCYWEKYQEKYTSYIGCTMSENFKYFPYFKEWCSEQTGLNLPTYQLDKDLLVKGNKIYSEDTCVFVPREINNLTIFRKKSRGEYPLGVSWDVKSSKYRSQLQKGDKKVSLGWFDSPLEAFVVYKEAKEDYIKQKAEFWKGQIDPKVYDALMNFTIEITD